MTLLLLILAFSNPASLEEEYRAHVRFLADDLMEGRETGKRGQKLAAAYAASQLAAAGVLPAFPDSTTPYFQTFSLTTSEMVPSHVEVTDAGISTRISPESFNYRSWGDGDPNQTGEMVFVGYGVNHEGYNDYEGVDVEDRWIVAIRDEPKLGDISLPEDIMSPRKRLRAVFRGKSKGVIFLSEEEPKPTESEQEMSLAGDDEFRGTGRKAIITLSPTVQEKVFGRYYAQMQKAISQIREKGEPASFLLEGLSFAMKGENKIGEVSSENVVGILPGIDPLLKDEYVVLSAHYDHEGIKGNEVYNGADDNASGTATMLMMAEHLRQLPRRRSLILLLLTAEEKGLLGSQYFVAHPVVPLEKIVANVNVDMIGRGEDGKIGIVPSAGDDLATLSKMARTINENGKFGVAFRDDLDRYHTRSDHYNFIRKGVPAVFFFTGVHEDYHQPTDDWQKLNYKNMANFFTFFSAYTMNVLNGQGKPAFLEARNQAVHSD